MSCRVMLRCVPGPRRDVSRAVRVTQSFNLIARLSRHYSPYASAGSVYVHYPYCQSLCHYCNFNKYLSTSKSVDDEVFINYVVQDLQYQLRGSAMETVKTVYFGGGTPSLAPPSLVSRILEAIQVTARMEVDAQVTLEVNPSVGIDVAFLHDFMNAGINRVSVGIQTLRSDEELKSLGRRHTVADALTTIFAAKSVFPSRVSADFLFARPKPQSSSPSSSSNCLLSSSLPSTIDLTAELEQILEVVDDHLSVYQLTVERATPLFRSVKHGTVSMPTEVESAEMYETLVGTLRNGGFHQYEVSNFAANEEARSKHNINYWTGGQYIGVGPGAHGRVIDGQNGIKERRVGTASPNHWIRDVQRNGHGLRVRVGMTLRECLEELLISGLRTSAGVEAQRWNDITEAHSDAPSKNSTHRDTPPIGADGRVSELAKDLTLKSIFDLRVGSDVRRRDDVATSYLSTLFEEGFLRYENDSLLVPQKYLAVLDSILPHVLHHLDSAFDETRGNFMDRLP